jgi:hypothetical protein
VAVAFDAVGPAGGAGAASGSPISWTHICAASATLLLVGVSYDDFTFSTVTLSATYNGVAMTSLGAVNSNNNTAGFIQLFALASPSTGSNTVTVTRTSGSVAGMLGGSMSYTGSTGVPTATTAAGSSTTPSITVTSNVGDMAAAFMCDGQGFTAANQTLRYRRNDNTVTASGNIQGEDAAGAASVTLTGTTATSDWWGAIGVNIAASGGGGGAARTKPSVNNRAAIIRASTR